MGAHDGQPVNIPAPDMWASVEAGVKRARADGIARLRV